MAVCKFIARRDVAAIWRRLPSAEILFPVLRPSRAYSIPSANARQASSIYRGRRKPIYLLLQIRPGLHSPIRMSFFLHFLLNRIDILLHPWRRGSGGGYLCFGQFLPSVQTLPLPISSDSRLSGMRLSA